MKSNFSPLQLGSSRVELMLLWAVVALPLGWGVWKVASKAVVLFGM